jgi:hypothetical protein
MHKYLVEAGIDKAKFAETVGEEADVGTGCADYLGQGLRAHLESDWDGRPSPLLCRCCGREHGCEESFGELRIAAEQVHHGLLLYTHNGAAQERARRGAADCLTGQTAFAQEAAFGKNGDDCLLAVYRFNGDPHLATLVVASGLPPSTCVRKALQSSRHNAYSNNSVL